MHSNLQKYKMFIQQAHSNFFFLTDFFPFFSIFSFSFFLHFCAFNLTRHPPPRVQTYWTRWKIMDIWVNFSFFFLRFKSVFSINHKIFRPETKINFLSGITQYTKEFGHTLGHCCCSWTQDSFKFLGLSQCVKIWTKWRYASKKTLSFELKCFANKNCMFLSIALPTVTIHTDTLWNRCYWRSVTTRFNSEVVSWRSITTEPNSLISIFYLSNVRFRTKCPLESFVQAEFIMVITI